MDELLLQIISLDTYNDVSYFTTHLTLPLYRLFGGTKWRGVPYYLQNIVSNTSSLIEKSGLSQEEILQWIANDMMNPSYFFVSYCILSYAIPIKLDDSQKYDIANKTAPLPKDVVIDKEVLACSLACYVLDGNRYSNWDFNKLVPNEKFAYKTTDYHLTQVTNIDFKQNGFIFDSKYYLYNIYINRKPLYPDEPIPAIFKVMIEETDFSNANFYMRLDERLSVPLINADITHYSFSERFRGTDFKFNNSKLERIKNIIVHYNPDTNNKLLFIIKKDYDTKMDKEFWHIEIEQLPYITDASKSHYVSTVFIHGKYYPKDKLFRHIDYIINQYPIDQYFEKQADRVCLSIQKFNMWTRKSLAHVSLVKSNRGPCVGLEPFR